MSFHSSLGEISITLDDVSCLFNFFIKGKLLDHGRISKNKALELMVDYMRVDPEDAMRELEKTRGAHARFQFLKNVYIDEILIAEQARGDVEQVRLHRAYAMRAHLLYLVGITVSLMWMSSTYGTSRTLSKSMCTTRGRLFSPLVLKVIRGL